MPVYNDTTVDRDEERQVEEGKSKNKRDIERRQQRESMKTFEAKLSEKTAHDIATKDGVARQEQDSKRAKEERESMLEKIINVSKEKVAEADRTKIPVVQRRDEKTFEEGRDRKTDDSKTEDKKFETKKDQKAEAKKGELSDEGYRRVAQKEDQGGSGGGAGGQGGDSSQKGTSFGFGSQSQGQDSDELRKGTTDQLFATQLKGVNKTRFFSQGGFDKNARDFSNKDLDEIVTNIHLGLNEKGEEEFSVQLSDSYYDGLKVSATRTPEGVVMKFLCPNASVRSTFIKCRPQLYSHFKAKQISVLRIDVV